MNAHRLGIFGLGIPLLAAVLVPTLAASARPQQDPKVLERAFQKVCSDCHEPESESDRGRVHDGG